MYKTSSQNANILKLLKTLQEINSIAHKTTWKQSRAIYKPTKLIKIILLSCSILHTMRIKRNHVDSS